MRQSIRKALLLSTHRASRVARAAVCLAAAFAATASAAATAAPAQAAVRSHLWDWGPGPLGLGKYADRTRPVPVHGLGTAPVQQVASADGTVLGHRGNARPVPSRLP